ncbi:MAG: 30S ribosomal protein S12 methylthiotransferase RimO [Nitrospiraceae bacterium]|nr:30S ribosomal protein S12 methylthiotransferase RimO [Nitrospiraceae bacterium]
MSDKVSIISLGCPKNLTDSDCLIKKLVSSGFTYVPTPDKADIVLVNTCGFINDAKKESIDEIIKMGELKKKSSKKLIVFGCLAKRYKDELIKTMPEADAIFGVGEEDKIIEYCKKISSPTKTCSVKDQKATYLMNDFPYAYLKISEGCSKKCTYCIIPSIRGSHRSFSPDMILKNAELLIRGGKKELILVAQDTACYKNNIGYDLAALLEDICSINGDFWVRVLYLYPESINDKLLSVIADQDKICKYLDIPFQHSENRILKLMGRKGTKKNYLDLIKSIRKDIPDVVLRTSMIVGFPSETKEEFNSLIDFIEETQIEKLGAFKYSKEEGTPAYRLKGHIKEEIKNKRLETLLRHQADISLAKNQILLDRRFRALIDEIYDRTLIARLYSHAPEIDGVIVIDKDTNTLESNKTMPGQFVDVKITEAFEYDLKGALL